MESPIICTWDALHRVKTCTDIGLREGRGSGQIHLDTRGLRYNRMVLETPLRNHD